MHVLNSVKLGTQARGNIAAGVHRMGQQAAVGSMAPGHAGQGGLVCCSPWGRKESDTNEQLN